MTLSLEQKVGQTLMIGFDGTELTPELRAMIAECHIGGVILFARNVESPEQVARLTNDIQRAARECGSPGLFVAIDQEGGRVARLAESQGFTQFPSAMAAGATGDPTAAEQIGRGLARELRAIGVNVDFAPNLDVNNNPANPVIGTRSYGSDPARVAAFGVAAVRGLQDEGVLAFGKHFPGHGDTDIDSHVSLPSVPRDRAQLEATELPPFRAAIAAGVAGIMSAHVTFPAIEPRPNVPATLSGAALSGLLREELGFDGLIVTDSLEMGALATLGYSPASAARAALAAGADILLFNNGHDDHRQAFGLIRAGVERGEIPAARLDDAVARILRAKTRYGLLDPVPVDASAASSRTGTPELRATAREITARSITLLRDDAALLPLAEPAKAAVLEMPGLDGLARALGALAVTLDTRPTRAQIAAAVGLGREGYPLILGISENANRPEQIELARALLAAGARLILIAVRDPYDLLAVPEAPTMLATYATPAAVLAAPLADLLAGRQQPRGRLPVDLPGMFAPGSGLQEFQPR